MQPLGKKFPVTEMIQLFGSSAHTTLTYTEEELLQSRNPMGCQGRWKIQNKSICFFPQNVKMQTSFWEEAMDDKGLHGFKNVTTKIRGRKIHQLLIKRLLFCFRKFLNHKLLEVGNLLWRNSPRLFF